ncbi:hypothetical protein OF83DRAFT_1175709 [Amylostereum chailletii]|nr:hypothetical protein OF83DRAFT_1175709 [Amylostereum chailletii]
MPREASISPDVLAISVRKSTGPEAIVEHMATPSLHLEIPLHPTVETVPRAALLALDPPRTTIKVPNVHWSARSNGNRWFILSADAGNGKPSWSVRKLYTDVHQLDRRVRVSHGRQVRKNLSRLPDGKALWSDPTPSQVDELKA